MKEKICDILSEIDLEIDEIDLYGYDIIETSLQWYADYKQFSMT